MLETIPSIGFGVGTSWSQGALSGPKQVNQELVLAIKTALQVGYRHLDFAEWYNNEEECALALHTLPVSREELWITTKVVHSLADPMSYVQDTLSRLKIDYFDCLLIHTPFRFQEELTLQTTWSKMEEIHKQGLARYIGVSNFRKCDLQHLMSFCKVRPYVNQCENHPYVQHHQKELQAYMKENSITWASYAPLASITRCPGGPVDLVIANLAKKYGRSESQILLRYQLDKNHIVLTTSSKHSRMAEQLLIRDFSLSEDDVAEIDREGEKLYHRAFFQEETDA